MADLLPKEEKICENDEKHIIQINPKFKIGYVYSLELIQQCNRVPNLTNRVSKCYSTLFNTESLLTITSSKPHLFYFQASLIHHLLKSYGLLDHVLFLNSDKVSDDVFQGFHSGDYIEFLKKGDVDVEDETSEEYGLGNKMH